MADGKRALVLGGGGPVGIAWEAALLAGLADAGVRLVDADCIIGTSAGSVVGAMVALGRDPREAYAGPGRNERERPAQSPPDLAPLMAQFMKLFTGERPPEELRAEVGAFALQAQTMPEDEWVGWFAQLLDASGGAWPERTYMCTAVDAQDGEFVVWDAAAGVPLHLAVASSCAVPGIFPPVSIKGRRYMDGGVRSGTCADLAAGYEKVAVVAVTGGAANSALPLAEVMRRRFEAELDRIREAGGEVEVIRPDEAFAKAIGMNLMDGSLRKRAAELGEGQAKAEAARIGAFWG
jgi:NTE family protein